MKKQAIITLAIIISLVTFSTAAMAWGPGSGKGYGKRYGQGQGMGQGQGNGMAAQFQSLSEEQQVQLKALHQKFIDETAEVRTALVSKFEGIRILMETSTPDRATLIALANEIGDLKKQVMEKRIDFGLEAKTIAPELDLPLGFGDRGCGYGMGMGGFGKKGCRRMTSSWGYNCGQAQAAGCPGQARIN